MSGGGSSGAGIGGEAEVSSGVLSAPPGWTKKVTTPLKGTPKRKEIIFVAPTGEELNSKRQVEKYLKSHPGGPELSEFYWGSGETPRRSSRLGVKTKEVDTPESEPPKKRSRKSLEKKGDDIETEAALEVKPGDDVQMHDAASLEKKGDDVESEAALEVKLGDDVQMHDTEAAVTEEAVAEVKAVDVQETPELNSKSSEVKAVDVQETPELNSIDDLRAPVVPSVEVDVVEEPKVETKKDDTVAEETEEEIPISEPTPLSGDKEVAVKDDTKAPEDPQVKVDMNVQVDASNEQQQVKVDCPEEVVVVVENDVARETEHVGWTREIQVEDGNPPPSPLFVEKKVGPTSEVTAADTPKVNAEDGEVKPQPPQQKFDIDLEQLPAP